MPDININEIDNTTAGTVEYQNFSVVIPGFVDPNITEDAFDVNGIYEVNNLKDFRKYIGFRQYQSETRVTDAVAPKPKMRQIPIGEDEYLDVVEYRTITLNEVFDGDIKYGELYKPTESAEAETGYLKGEFYLQPEEGQEPVQKYYTFVQDLNPDEDTKYVIIPTGKEGQDRETILIPATNKGNQMAFELVKLGFTVLYKRIPEPTIIEGEETGGLEVLRNPEFWEALKDKSTYDFRYITTGGYDDSIVFRNIADIAYFNSATVSDDTFSGRGDCIALLDVPENDERIQNAKSSQSALIKAIKEVGLDYFSDELLINQFSHLYTPNVEYEFGLGHEYDNSVLPGSFHYLVCAAKAFATNNEWYAVAGYERGICDLKIKNTTLNLGELAVSALEPRYGIETEDPTVIKFNKAINVITKIRGNYYLWGNRTAHTIKVDGLIASDFANIRELCVSLKKVIYIACKQLSFNPNSDLLWVNFCNKVRPTLDKMKADQGVADYKFVKVKTDIKGLCKGKIRIVPIEAVEDFEIDVTLEDNISGIIADLDED